jgi:glycerol-3-phosphate dehydrogenase
MEQAIIEGAVERIPCKKMNRNEILSALRHKPDVSVLIVGGGINGIGTFRDLALNDVDVLLVEKGDFCSGASSASSHMAHGGIRYLENGEFCAVRAVVQERKAAEVARTLLLLADKHGVQL